MKRGNLQHWDVVTHFELDYFQAQIIKYVMRHRDKGGRQDLEKAQHFLEKYIDISYNICTCGAEKDPTRWIHLPNCNLEKDNGKTNA